MLKVGGALVNRMVTIGLAEKVTFKENREGGERLGEENSRQREVKKRTWGHTASKLQS